MADFGTHYKLLINEVDAFEPTEAAPKLPVARVMWTPRPDFHQGVKQWIRNGRRTSYGCFISVDVRSNRDVGKTRWFGLCDDQVAIKK